MWVAEQCTQRKPTSPSIGSGFGVETKDFIKTQAEQSHDD